MHDISYRGFNEGVPILLNNSRITTGEEISVLSAYLFLFLLN